MASGAMGAAAVWQWKRRRPAQQPQPAAGSDPAQELRARLDESRAAPAEPAAPVSEAAPPAVAADPEARRRSVHDDARSRIDDLKSDTTEEGK